MIPIDPINPVALSPLVATQTPRERAAIVRGGADDTEGLKLTLMGQRPRKRVYALNLTLKGSNMNVVAAVHGVSPAFM
jgi:hypothetical protein